MRNPALAGPRLAARRLVALSNGVAAVNLLKRSIPDLIVMDLRMPKMDGFQLLNLLKKYKSSAAIPVVVLTGSSNPFDIDRALAGDFGLFGETDFSKEASSKSAGLIGVSFNNFSLNSPLSVDCEW